MSLRVIPTEGEYALADGRMAGFLIVDTCDSPGCEVTVGRSTGDVCGLNAHIPGYVPGVIYGCGNYYCDDHKGFDAADDGHDCAHPQCEAYPSDWKSFREQCVKAHNHGGAHCDEEGVEFQLT